MELMAILALALNPPERDVLVYSDSAYVVRGCQRLSSPSTRRQLRRSNRHLWARLQAAIAVHKGNDFKFVVAKCAAHGKDAKQAEHITTGNDRADGAAKLANKGGHLSLPLLKDPFHHRLLFRGRTVRGDPRRHMKKHFQFLHFESATLVPKAGVVAEQIRPPTPYSAHSITTPISGRKAYKNGHVVQTAFMYAARTNALYTPSKSYRNTFVKGKPVPIDTISLRERALTPLEPGDPPRFPPKEAFVPTDTDGSPLCPLCLGPNPDSHHYLSHNCPNVLEESGLLRRSAASLIESLNAFTEHANPTIPQIRIWLSSLVPNLGYATTKDIPQDGSSQFINGCRLKAWPEDGINLPSTGLHFGIFPSDLLSDGESHGGRPCPFRFKYLFHIPRKRAIGKAASGKTKDSYEKPRTFKAGLSLVAIGDPILPSIDIDDVERLGISLRDSMIWGPHKLSLHWNGTSWPLDSLIEDPQPILTKPASFPLIPPP